MLCLVIYDIVSDKKRKALADKLFDFGLERIQYSGFKGELNANDRMLLIKEVRQFVDNPRDSIYVIPLCDRCSNTAEVISETGITLIKESKVTVV